MKSYKKRKAKTLGPSYRTPDYFKASKFSGGNPKVRQLNSKSTSYIKTQHKG